VIFESLNDSAKAGELLLIDGGYCRWHLRRDGIITIYEIIATRPGAGWEMLSMLIERRRPIVARCPVHMTHANAWWQRRGFRLVAHEDTRNGVLTLNVWRLEPC
jgi:hypothetical protein